MIYIHATLSSVNKVYYTVGRDLEAERTDRHVDYKKILMFIFILAFLWFGLIKRNTVCFLS